ncbi:hypothetical protein L9F63_000075, partial [Diploptera punctata]
KIAHLFFSLPRNIKSCLLNWPVGSECFVQANITYCRLKSFDVLFNTVNQIIIIINKCFILISFDN